MCIINSNLLGNGVRSEMTIGRADLDYSVFYMVNFGPRVDGYNG